MKFFFSTKIKKMSYHYIVYTTLKLSLKNIPVNVAIKLHKNETIPNSDTHMPTQNKDWADPPSKNVTLLFN